jgi:hypothetical protein
MRNAALVLGLIGGLWGMVIGFFGFGYAELTHQYAELSDVFGAPQNPALLRTVSFLAPVMAIAGAAMARSANVAAGVLLLGATVGFYTAFGFGVFTMFPLMMCGLGGLLALAARRPDPH